MKEAIFLLGTAYIVFFVLMINQRNAWRQKIIDLQTRVAVLESQVQMLLKK